MVIYVDSLKFEGVEELENALYEAAKKYPDLAEDTLRKEQREFRFSI